MAIPYGRSGGKTRFNAPTGAAPPKASDGKYKADNNFSWIFSDTPHKEAMTIIRKLIQLQQNRLWDSTRFFSLYTGTDMNSAFYSYYATFKMPSPHLVVNLVKTYGDSLAGKLIQNYSRVSGQTANGDFSLAKKVKKLDIMFEGEFARGHLYDEAWKVALDAINVGTGYLHVYPDNDGKKICYERVFPNEIFVDEMEAAFAEPSIMFRLRYMKRENARAYWPDRAADIEGAQAPAPPLFGWSMFQPGMIEVLEAWALPKGSRKGRHILCLTNCTLVDEEWKEDHFPIAVFKAGVRPLGWYGQGYVEHVGGLQVELNKILQVMARAAHLGIAPYWVIQNGAKINIKQLTNMTGHIVTADGPAPQWVTNEPFSQAAPAYVQLMSSKIADFYGISSMEVTGQLPINRLDSRKALVEFQDMNATRQTMLLQMWQRFFLDVADRTFMFARMIAKDKGAFPVIVKDGPARSKTLDWKDFADLDRNAYRLYLAPSNFLSTTVAAKKNDIIDLLKAQDSNGTPLITSEQALALLQGPPDIASVVAEVSAPENYIDYIIEKLLNGEYESPSELIDPSRAIKRIRDAALQAQVDDAPPEVLDLFDRFLGELTQLKIKATPPPPPMAPPGMGPGGPPPPPGAGPLG